MKYSIFSMQMALPMTGPDDPLHRELRRLITTAPERTSYRRMHDHYGRITQVLSRETHRFEKGVWDYWDDPARAPRDFQEWVEGLEGKEARLLPAHAEDEPRYLVCTLALLLQNGSTSDRRMLAHCDIPEDRLWRRDTFQHLLKGPGLLNFLHVQSDLVYMLPGEDSALALTAKDLSQEDWHYLRELD